MSERILVVDDVSTNLDVLVDLLEPRGYQVLAATSGDEAQRIAESARPSVILLDVMMPGVDGYETCRRLKAAESTANIPIIFVTGRDDPTSVVEGFRAGGVDYVTKPFHAEEVLMRVQLHLSLFDLTRRLSARATELAEANARLEREVARRHDAESALDHADGRLCLLSEREQERWGVEGFIGKSPTIAAILDSIRRVQGFATTSVLITGESGTGKELVARAIHFGSSRAAHPFVPVNCSAVPPELAESAFFGHRRGAFTGADRDRKGYFALAERGTLFLDEVGDMPASVQAKLLRVLESHTYRAVGDDHERHADVRIVAATNVDLEERIREGRFRQDLYYRLARFSVMTPPLRERPEDVPLLADHFLRVVSTEMTRKPPPFSVEAIDCLRRYPFPGNVRELKNIVERALIESGGAEIRPSHLGLPARGPSAPPTAKNRPEVSHLPLNLEAAERALIERALSESGGNVAQAARLLGVPRMRIYRRIGGGRPADST